MKVVLNSEYDNKVREEWLNIINNRPVTPGAVRLEVLECWNKCLDNNLNPYGLDLSSFSRFSADDFQDLLFENKLMCNIAEPFMRNISKNIPAPSSSVVLLDKNCISLLKISENSNEEYDNYLKSHGMLPGDYSSFESVVPAFPEVYLCKKTLQPQYCYGEENFFSFSKDWMCVAAPILNQNGELEGILSISDTKENYDRQCMGLVISTAKAIENEMKMTIANNNLANIVEQLNATIELVTQGLILIDQTGAITFSNEYAKKILFIDEDIKWKKISDVLVDDLNIFSTMPLSPMSEKEVMLQTPAGFKRYYIMIRTFVPNHCPELGLLALITIKEADYARKLSNKVTASYAKFDFTHIIGRSKKMTDAINLAKIASKSTSTVLITGASGTGKELFAHAIHSASSRSDGPFISINCGALPSNLVESELFGYEGGSFTGSRKNGQIGKFELANHGTLFLDEIGEMPLSVQASILRAIETKEVTRIGGSKPNMVDVRIVAATNKNLADAIKEKQFREDLYYRLNVLRLHVPSLRERKSDIRLLANKFIDIYTSDLNKHNITLSDNAYMLLEDYNWPGNVRELENTIERIINICEDDTDVTSDLIGMFISVDYPDNIAPSTPRKSSSKNSLQIKDVEKDLIIDTLTETRGSVTETANIIGIGRRTLYRKCEEYGIDYNSYRKIR